MELSIGSKDFLDSFQHIWEKNVDDYGTSRVNLFVLNINANNFDYSSLTRNLLDPLIDYSVSRKIKEKFKGKPHTLTRTAQEKFKEYISNTGELGEFLLYCFLESHLEAPKILSKLELKTSTSMYVHGADGVHFLKLDNGDYQLIFGESKTIKGMTDALSAAFTSIYEFKNEINKDGKQKSGINYEKTLLHSNLDKEAFTDEERLFLENLIYPQKDREFYVDDAFGIFIGYEIEIATEDMKLPNDQFRQKIISKISEDVSKRLTHIAKKIDEYKLYGHNFYIYVMPFSELDDNRRKILEEIV